MASSAFFSSCSFVSNEKPGQGIQNGCLGNFFNSSSALGRIYAHQAGNAMNKKMVWMIVLANVLGPVVPAIYAPIPSMHASNVFSQPIPTVKLIPPNRAPINLSTLQGQKLVPHIRRTKQKAMNEKISATVVRVITDAPKARNAHQSAAKRKHHADVNDTFVVRTFIRVLLEPWPMSTTLLFNTTVLIQLAKMAITPANKRSAKPTLSKASTSSVPRPSVLPSMEGTDGLMIRKRMKNDKIQDPVIQKKSVPVSAV